MVEPNLFGWHIDRRVVCLVRIGSTWEACILVGCGRMQGGRVVLIAFQMGRKSIWKVVVMMVVCSAHLNEYVVEQVNETHEYFGWNSGRPEAL